MKNKNKYLFLVVIGGRVPKANIEIHDVRWVVGSTIKETFDVLRKDWIGSKDGLHIDSYKKIVSVDGYNVNLKKKETIKKDNIGFKKKIKTTKKLWFVNLGGYDPSSMQEKHEFGFVVASNALEAKNIAKSKWLIGLKKRHKDDIAYLKIFKDVDNCEIIKNVGIWEIELSLDDGFVNETQIPDWYGYMRIDKAN
tara:strand:+ start:286 stop:870 length:585 start_codon:yes stop_codon:yes gene_type:complete